MPSRDPCQTKALNNAVLSIEEVSWKQHFSGMYFLVCIICNRLSKTKSSITLVSDYSLILFASMGGINFCCPSSMEEVSQSFISLFFTPSPFLLKSLLKIYFFQSLQT